MKSLIASRQEPVTVRHYDRTVDDYGQQHTKYTERTSNMFLTKYTQTPQSDIRYNDVVYIGLTHDNEISDQDNILYQDKEYKVRYTIEAVGPIHWRQVFLALAKN